MADGVSRRGRKTALSIYFTISLLAFLFCLLSLLSPSWQYAYLENGRTEHHHGLWLDCKRDYSFDYGRTREYYETLYRRDLQGSPFEMFFLPPLQCIYKFDYYIDPNELYDHDHDENRLQNDANQHLFLGWKIAVLSAVGTAAMFGAATILLGICSFCHRTFICASTVLNTIAAMLSTAGTTVFFMWANYQDNKVIKEEDEETLYEQSLGWAFYFQVVAAILFWLSSMLGCCVTSISFSKQRAKLVKIEVVEGEESIPLSSQSSQPFKRSFSAIYRVDSQALRQWEKDYMRNAAEVQRRRSDDVNMEGNFKRTASVPNFSKKQRKELIKKQRQMTRSNQDLFSSTSNVTEMTNTGSNFTLSTQTNRNSTQFNQNSLPRRSGIQHTPLPVPPLKSALKTPQSSRKTLNDTDNTYDYLPCPSSMGISTLGSASRASKTYDAVYEQIGQEAYMEPNSRINRFSNSTVTFENEKAKRALMPSLPLPSGSSQSIPNSTVTQRTTLIDDVITKHRRPQSYVETGNDPMETLIEGGAVGGSSKPDPQRIRERMIKEEMIRMERFRRIQETKKPDNIPPKPPMNQPPAPPNTTEKPSLSIRDFGISLNQPTQPGTCQEISNKRDINVSRESNGSPGKSSDSGSATSSLKYALPTKKKYRPGEGLTIDEASARLQELCGRSRSSMHSRKLSMEDFPKPPPGIAINTFGYAGNVAHRSITNLTSAGAASTSGAEIFDRPESVISEVKIKPVTPSLLRKPWLKVLPDEVDRSIGSSTMFENDTLSEAGSYARDAEVRLNLFMNDKTPKSKDETTV